MPDWIGHVTAAWIICRLLSLKYKEFDTTNTVLVMIGSILPDLYKVVIFFPGMKNLLMILHIPVGTLIVAGIFSILFLDKKKAFLLLTLGILTHYILDMLQLDFNGGMYLLFPFSWYQFTFSLITTDNVYFTLGMLATAVLVYIITFLINKKIDNSR
jgi:hypothetical protein